MRYEYYRDVSVQFEAFKAGDIDLRTVAGLPDLFTWEHAVVSEEETWALVREVVEGLGSGKYPFAALVMPASVDDIRTVSETGERMPAKSTYFYPKLASGLVFNPLE